MEPRHKRQNLDGLTGLRFVAAFYVLLFHMNIRTPYTFLPNFIQEIFMQGALGVTLFFVLSGFILTFTYRDKPAQEYLSWKFFKSFLAKRFARIYPAYIASILVCLAISAVVGVPDRFSTIFCLDAFMLNSWVPELAMKWFGGGGWSISTEFFFYLCFPLLLPIAQSIQSKRLIVGLLILFIALSAFPGYATQYYPESLSTVFAYTFPLCRVAEFICGIIVARLVFEFRINVKPTLAIFAIGVATFYITRFGFRFRRDIFVIHHLVVVPAFAILIASIAQFGTAPVFKWLQSRPMVYLGKVSYSFYLLQMPVFIIIEHLKDKNYLNNSSFWTTPIILITNLGASVLLYELIEHPIHKKLTNAITKRSLKTKAAMRALDSEVLPVTEPISAELSE
jgi:peptidoglycan/LPS O-acetylase OafA/YrhL